ncbi:zinc finger protein [Tokyovirus A1]|uniref:zinc finger protein n=1 Tax=Tokyovirus A1 TaxID=1826170 RepID=UPI0007A96E53|nr:zinc finger protein [Tokyovirus A1]BAU80315.1 zinc finger protein [Tokyovirus A1]
MGSKKNTQDVRLECETCGFSSTNDHEFGIHVREHYEKIGLSCSMKCHSCSFETDSATLLWMHVQKKRHMASKLYKQALEHCKGKRSDAYALTAQTYGEKTATKVSNDLADRFVPVNGEWIISVLP